MAALQNIKKRISGVAMFLLNILIKNDRSDISSDSESSEDEDDSENENISLNDMRTLFALLIVDVRGEKIVVEKITDYVDRVIPNYTDVMFKQHFRVYPTTFEMILSLIGPALTATGITFGRKPISAEKQLYIALWFMATPDSYRSICVKFGVGRATAFRAVRRVTYALHCIAPQFIQWSKDVAAAVDVMEHFKKTCGFPNVIGAIDGTHIKIRAPPVDAASYINRKGFPSLNVQLVCDSHGLFTHCYAGEVGSLHDARVFRNSLAIGQLKIRFRILLDCLPLTDVKKIPEFIIACCVLHNICILQNDVMIVGVQHYEQAQALVRNNNTEMGNAKRIRITNELQMKRI